MVHRSQLMEALCEHLGHVVVKDCSRKLNALQV